MYTLKQLREFVAANADLPEGTPVVISTPLHRVPALVEGDKQYEYENITVEDVYLSEKRGTGTPVIRVTVLDEEFVAVYRKK